MKKYEIPVFSIFVALLILGFCTFLGLIIHSNVNEQAILDKQRTYAGPLVDKGYDHPSSGYKSSQDAVYWIVIQDTISHSKVRVHVTPNTYYSTDSGESISFSMSLRNFKEYGN